MFPPVPRHVPTDGGDKVEASRGRLLALTDLVHVEVHQDQPPLHQPHSHDTVVVHQGRVEVGGGGRTSTTFQKYLDPGQKYFNFV